MGVVTAAKLHANEGFLLVLEAAKQEIETLNNE
jgi:hypothetical protein